MDDAVALFTRARELDIKIILDFVPNHSSDQCEWFLLSAANDPTYRDYYIWHEGVEVGGQRVPPNNWVRREIRKSMRTNFKLRFTEFRFLRIGLDME